jgi:hypothetical protein
MKRNELGGINAIVRPMNKKYITAVEMMIPFMLFSPYAKQAR